MSGDRLSGAEWGSKYILLKAVLTRVVLTFTWSLEGFVHMLRVRVFPNREFAMLRTLHKTICLQMGGENCKVSSTVLSTFL